MRTLEDMQRDYEIAKKELEPIEKEREKAVKKCDELYREMENYKLQNGLFHKMSELEKHKGRRISSIKLVVREKNGKLYIKDMYGDECFRVDKNGHLYYSSWEKGVMIYDESRKKYSYCYHCYESLYDFVGYLEVNFEDEEETGL